MSPQTTDNLLWECEPLRKQRQILRKSITKADGNWPITNSDLAIKYSCFNVCERYKFWNFVNGKLQQNIFRSSKLTYENLVNRNKKKHN